MPAVQVKMTVHECAELLTAYAPVGVSVRYSPAVKISQLAWGTIDTVDLDETLFDPSYSKEGAPEQ